MRASRLATSLVVAVLVTVAVAACTTGSGTSEPAASPSVGPTAEVSSTTVQGTSKTEPAASVAAVLPQLPSLDLCDVSDLVKQVRGGVVSVTQERVRLDLFGAPAGADTGIVIDDAGLVLTNFHVIQGASRVIVTGEDGRQRDADVVAEAPARDLALLQLDDTDGLIPLPFGTLEQLEVGDPMIAVRQEVRA